MVVYTQMLSTSALWYLKQEDYQFEASTDYIVKLYLKVPTTYF